MPLAPITCNPSQIPADAAVVIPTILRPSLLKAVRSVFTQNFLGRIQLLIGIDIRQGDASMLDLLASECPDHVSLTILDPGYSTSARHGGLHANFYGGALRSILSLMANARHVAYLDDNDWWGANHLVGLKAAITDKAWAWSGRWMVHPGTHWPICPDEWDSVGPGKGINAQRFGGFVQPSGLMMDAQACHLLMPLWSMAAFPDGSGEDRLIFDQLNKTLPGSGTGAHTAFCTLSPETMTHDHHRREFLARGLDWVEQPTRIAAIIDALDEAKAARSRNDWQGVSRAAEQALSLHPHHAEALALSAEAAHSQGQNDHAIALLSQAISVDDSRPPWLDLLAKWLELQDRNPEAERVKATRQRRFPI